MNAEDFSSNVTLYETVLEFLFSYDQVDLKNDTQYIQTQFVGISDALEMNQFNKYSVELQNNEFDNYEDLVGLFSNEPTEKDFLDIDEIDYNYGQIPEDEGILYPGSDYYVP